MGAEAQIRSARVLSIYERLAVTSLITVINAVLMTLVLERRAVMAAPLVWLALVVALSMGRAASGRIYQGDIRREAHLQRWEALAVAGSALSGALWGLGAGLLFPPDETGQWLWIFLIAGMSAGAASLHAAHLPTAMSFIVPAVAPLAVRLALEGSSSRLAAAVMMVMFLIILGYTASRFSRQFGEVLRLQLDLQHRTEALDETNRLLLAEIDQHQATADILHQAQKMEALGHITGGIAHDFNNLLTVITGNLELIRRRADADETLQRLTAAAIHAARRGARLTGSLLSFARKQSLHPEPLDLGELIMEFAPVLRRAAGETIDLEFDLGPDAAAYVDAAHFQSALLNLVINARDAMPGGGEMTISTRSAELGGSDLVLDSETHLGRAVVVCVRDTGVGMPPEIAAQAFEPFFTTKEVGKGSGLGLAQVYGFARQSGGYATVDSRPGEGAEVCIILPALSMAAEPQVRAIRSAPPPARGPLRVLLAEDDHAVAEVLRESLGLLGWEVIHAPAGQAALDLLQSPNDIHVLVTDVVMTGGLGGVDLARRAGELRPGLPVLLISGYPGDALSASGLIDGEFDLLLKPFDHQQLADRIQACVARRSTLNPDAAPSIRAWGRPVPPSRE